MQKCRIPKTAKIWNFVHKFAPRGELFAQYLQNAQHLYASIVSIYVFLTWSFLCKDNQVISIYP